MRDPERIDRVLKKIEKFWKIYPDLRLGQMLVIIHNLSTHGKGADVFNTEDDEWEKWLDYAIETHEKDTRA
jgi:hypothetical protein